MNAQSPRRCSRRAVRLAAALMTLLSLALAPAAAQRDSGGGRNVVLVLIDGLRWREVFTGAEERLISKEAGGVARLEAVREQFWRDTPEARREALMPFLWRVAAKEGQLYGNRLKGSPARVTNPHHFSYPGYSEMIVGYVDPRIDSNAKKPNPNVTVFEWLHRKPAFRGKVAAFGAWDVVPYILNRERCGFYVNGGWEPVTGVKTSPRQNLLNQLRTGLPKHPWPAEPYDAITFFSALEYLRDNRPRAMWITFGETDEWAHARRYDLYLDAARRTDGFLQTLWETCQSLPGYRNRTTLIVAVDHGRGRTPQDWTSHGKEFPGADEIWLAVLGPDTPPLGERANVAEVTQNQIAATLAAAVGEDYRAAVPQAAPPIAEAIAGRRR